jgi:hypothetical protein
MLTSIDARFGVDFYWLDKHCDNLLAPASNTIKSACRAVTAIEVLEHLTDPVAFIEETLAFSGAQTLLFTTELYEGPPPPPGAWWYYAFATGQYIGFFQLRTLEALGARLGLQFFTGSGLHIFSKVAVNEPYCAQLRDVWPRMLRLGGFADAWVENDEDHQLMLQSIG